MDEAAKAFVKECNKRDREALENLKAIRNAFPDFPMSEEFIEQKEKEIKENEELANG